MNVYHGSYMEIAEIDLSKCEKNKDFGQGFYVTKYKKILFYATHNYRIDYHIMLLEVWNWCQTNSKSKGTLNGENKSVLTWGIF